MDIKIWKNEVGPLPYVQSLSCVRLFVTPWTAAHQASLSTKSWGLLKLMSIKLVMPSKHLILCHPLFLLPSIFPSIRVFSSESVLCIRWPRYWSFSFSISPSKAYSILIEYSSNIEYPSNVAYYSAIQRMKSCYFWQHKWT